MKVSTRKITVLMGAKLLTQRELAELANISRATINATLLKGSCSTQTAGRIARALDVGPAEIIETEE